MFVPGKAFQHIKGQTLSHYENSYFTCIKIFITLGPGLDVIILFMHAIFDSQQARVVVPVKYFKPSLMFVGKVKSLP